MTTIRAVFCDGEGCLNPGKGMPFSLPALHELSQRLARPDPVQFSVCTGRPVPYVEAVVQVLGLQDSHFPCICEGGAVLYWPASDEWEMLADPIDTEWLLEELPPGMHRLEPGKTVCVTLYPIAPTRVVDLFCALEHKGRETGLQISRSAAAVDITPSGVTKASAVKEVCRRFDLDTSEILCIGDAENDLSMLRMAGYSACPNNAVDSVRQIVPYVADHDEVRGVVEILEHFANDLDRCP